MAYLGVQTYQLCDLPNIDGYEFTGHKKDGFIVRCKVKKCPVTGLHFVTGGARFDELYGWNPIRKGVPR